MNEKSVMIPKLFRVKMHEIWEDLPLNHYEGPERVKLELRIAFLVLGEERFHALGFVGLDLD